MRASLRLCSPARKRQVPQQYIDPRYPITQTLTDVFGGYKSIKSARRTKLEESHDRHPGRRAEVVSEKLCGEWRFAYVYEPPDGKLMRLRR